METEVRYPMATLLVLGARMAFHKKDLPEDQIITITKVITGCTGTPGIQQR